MAPCVDDLDGGQRAQDEVGLWQRLALAVFQADDLSAALRVVLEGVARMNGWACGQAWLPGVDETPLTCGPAWYASDVYRDGFRAICLQGAPMIDLPQRAWFTKQAIWSDSVALTAHLPRGACAQDVCFTAVVAVPVLAESEVVAVLHWGVVDTPGPDPQAMALIAAGATQLGPVIERKRADDALRRSEARYRAIVETATDAIITVTAAGTIHSFNQGAERAFGYTGAEVIDQPFILLMPERVRESYTAGFQRSLHTPHSRMFGRTWEAVGCRRNGTEFPIELTITEVQDGEVPVFVVMLRKITQRKLTETMLERQTALLQWQAQLLDLAHDAILVRAFDTDHILLWNQGAEALYGWTAAEALGQPALTLLHTDADRPLAAITAALLQHGRWEGELTHRQRDGTTIVVASRWAVQRNDQGEPVSVLEINTDITERKQIELERAVLLAAEQEHSKRLRELAALKADFTAMVAHELASPVSAIRIFADRLAAGDTPPEQRAQMIRAIQSEAQMITALVADVRTSAAAERDGFGVQRRPSEIGDLLRSAAVFAQSLAGAHPVLVTSVEAIVLADAERIGQVLRNLLSNAAKYSPHGTPIELRATVFGSRVRIEVADHGPGIDPQDIQRIFEKFSRGRDHTGTRVPGVGLGLYLSRAIVQSHGADLEVHSTPGAGSVFAFALEVVP
ncbi:MAG TPA: PAS domain S-box protein [Herpetosiphonaceae bacterium]